MGALDFSHTIQPEELDGRYYFQSLLEQAHLRGLLSDANLSQIQAELLMLLKSQADQWNQGKSSSVPIELAQEIFTSVSFVIGIQLKSCQTPEKAVRALRMEPLSSLFEKGLKLTQRRTTNSSHRQKCIAAHSLHTPKVFLVTAYPDNEPQTTLSYGEPMDDGDYQKLMDRILRAGSSEEKTAIILSEAHSLTDLLDVLSDGPLYQEDFDLLIDMLPTPEFATLLNLYPNDDFLERETEQRLYHSLQRRKQRLSTGEVRQIMQVTAALKNGNVNRE